MSSQAALLTIAAENSLAMEHTTLSENCHNASQLPCSGKKGMSCPPGLFYEEGQCECGVYPHDIIRCNGTLAFVQRSDCVTYSEDRNLILVGSCLSALYKKTANVSDVLYRPLPRTTNYDHLNNIACKSMNRTGALCGRCLPDHYPLVYSYNMTCIPCPHAHWNWFRYIMAAYLPLTIFYVVILFFKVNITSSYTYAVVYFCQTITTPVVARSIFFEIASDTNINYQLFAKILFCLFGIWNLDFSRPFYSHLCLGIGILPTLALDYVIAVYPLLLMIISYLLIVLYDRNYRVVTIMWRPFRKLFSLFRKKWNIRTSVIDAFATFFFLSNVKFLSVSFDFLIPVRVYQLYPDHYNYTLGLYYTGDLEYFGREHLPYAIMAIAVLCITYVFPVLILTLYPFRLFQNLIGFLPCRWYILHTFMDPFYGLYKNGTQPGTRDYRWCASGFFLLRFCQFLIYAIMSNKIIYSIIVTVFLIFYVILIAALQPFAVVQHNVITTSFLLLLSLFALSATAISISAIVSFEYVYIFFLFGSFISMMPLIFTALYWFYTHKTFAVGIVSRLKAWKSGYSSLSEPSDILPSRIENPNEYPRENLANFMQQPN